MKLFNRLYSITALLASAFVFTGCNGLIYDDEGDCDPYYKVKFVYDTNLKFTDAFPAEVFEVTLYVVDPATGRVVWQKHESGDALRRDGYLMDVDIDPGRYTLLAWCGEGHRSSFSVVDTDIHTDLRCRLSDRQILDSGHESSTELRRLYHGKSDNVEFEDEQGTHVKTVRLIKDTNTVHIVLQHLSGENIDHRDFSFTIEGDNGHMDYDNSLIYNPDERLTYRPYDVYSGTAGIYLPGDENRAAVVDVSAAVAHFSVSRLMEDKRKEDVFVKIYNKDGEKIVQVPFIDYALLVKGKYKRPDGTPLTDQEYLDYQDDYSMVFFLDEHNRWQNTHIYINSWRVILQNTDI